MAVGGRKNDLDLFFLDNPDEVPDNIRALFESLGNVSRDHVGPITHFDGLILVSGKAGRTGGLALAGHDIFISYCRDDRPAAQHFAACFAREGFTVWWDAVLRSGQTFDEVIEKELRAAKAVVVLWSPRSVKSRWVRAEATLADRSEKLIPVIIEACNRPIIFELTQAAPLADWTGDTSDRRWQELVSDLRGLVGGSNDAEPAPALAIADARSPVAQPVKTNAQASQAIEEALALAIKRLNKVPGSALASPTPLEDEQTQFFRRSDAYRLQESDTVHYLQKLDGDNQETKFVVGPSGLKIGRTAPANIIVADSGVSRAHCLVELSGELVRVSDLNSTNGTFIDEKRIDRSEILAVGSVLRVGKVSFEHEIRARAEMPAQDEARGFSAEAKPREARLARS